MSLRVDAGGVIIYICERTYCYINIIRFHAEIARTEVKKKSSATKAERKESV